MPPRARRRIRDATAQRAAQRHDENVPAPKEEAGMESFTPRTSTPARPRPAPKPVQRTALLHSSLPPSSPPLPTSSHERAHQEPAESDVPTAEDPFGFLAAERRLKMRVQRRNENANEERGRKILQPRAPHDENRPESVLAAMGVRVGEQYGMQHSEEREGEENIDDGRPAFATPPRASGDSDLELNMNTFDAGLATPTGHPPDPRAATPRQRRRKTKLPITPSSRSPSLGRESSAIPQTPSPNKCGRAERPPLANVLLQGNTPRKTSSKRTKGGKAVRKTRKTDETLAEEHLGGMTKALTELLPRRPTRRTARGRSTDAAKTAVTKTTTTATRRRRKGAQGAKSRSKKAKEKQEEGEVIGESEGESFVLNGEEREKFEADREARREYFRRLDDYVMDEESVYVI